MDPFTTSALIGAGASLFGSGMSFLGGERANSANVAMQESTNRMSLEAMRERMAWEERMSNTAHQREVSDLRAAGLNPILSATRGASVPSAGGVNLTAPRVEDSISKGVSSALGFSDQMRKYLDWRRASKETDSRIVTNSAVAASNLADAQMKGSSAKLMDLNSRLVEANLPAKLKEGKYADLTAYPRMIGNDIYQSVRNMLGVGQSAKDLIQPGISISKFNYKKR